MIRKEQTIEGLAKPHEITKLKQNENQINCNGVHLYFNYLLKFLLNI